MSLSTAPETPPRLSTPRLTLRPARHEDADAAVRALADFETVRMLAVVPYPYRVADWHAFVDHLRDQGEAMAWVIATPTDDQLIGFISLLDKEGGGKRLGYWLAPPARRQGLMREAVNAVLAHAFAAGVSEIASGYFDDNAASAALQRQLGFVETVRSAEACLARGVDVPHTDTVMTRAAYLAREQEGAGAP